jgi:hypothetical protein
MTLDLRYPVGKYEPKPFAADLKETWLKEIKFLPQAVENAILNLDKAQLETPYREGGWTVHQLVHHVADSHINAYCRFKLGLTEQTPTIRPYEEKLWAELDDVKHLPVNISITLLYALHTRWYEAMKHLDDPTWLRIVIHPDQNQQMTLWHLLGMYAWHGRHHVAHITSLRQRNHW